MAVYSTISKLYFKLKLYNSYNSLGFKSISSGSIKIIYLPFDANIASTLDLYTPKFL